jgi:N-acetyl-gamma-glutamylphosphate reductase
VGFLFWDDEGEHRSFRGDGLCGPRGGAAALTPTRTWPVAFTTGTGEGHLAHEAGIEQKADAYILAIPHGVSAVYVKRLHDAHPGAAIIDLSGDLRLPNAASYKAWYGHEHPAPELLGQVPYGLTEVFREKLRGARIVANPGCYATSACCRWCRC